MLFVLNVASETLEDVIIFVGTLGTSENPQRVRTVLCKKASKPRGDQLERLVPRRLPEEVARIGPFGGNARRPLSANQGGGEPVRMPGVLEAIAAFDTDGASISRAVVSACRDDDPIAMSIDVHGTADAAVRADGARRADLGFRDPRARRIEEGERAFSRLADTAQRHLGHSVVSYGLLVDDLHIYRAIVAHRPIGLEHPQSRAARALRDVARLLLDDAQDHTLG